MSKYSFALTENERLLLIFALGHCHSMPQLSLIAEKSEPPALAVELARRLMDMIPAIAPSADQVFSDRPKAPAPVASQPATPPSAPAPTGAAEGAGVVAIVPISITTQGTGNKQRLVVCWKEMQNAGRTTKTVQASCWISHKGIWQTVQASLNKLTKFYVKETNGYLSIVGMP